MRRSAGPAVLPPGAVGGTEGTGSRGLDSRIAVLGLATWAGALLGTRATPGAGAVVLALVAVTAWRWRRTALVVALGLLVLGGWAAGTLRAQASAVAVLAAYAEQEAVVRAEVQVTSDPRRIESRYGALVVTRGVVRQAEVRGVRIAGRAPVLMFADPGRGRLRLGERVRLFGRLSPSDDPELVALLSVHGRPTTLARPDAWWRGAARVRAGVRGSVAGLPEGPRGLVPALVDGDDGGLPTAVDTDFRTTGLTHLLAVSGTNLTLVSGFLVWLARGVGVRGRGLQVVAGAGIVGFVLLARGEPSVLRAAAMGAVGLVALGAAGRQQGPRAWGAAVTLLVLADPWLAASPGFALSALATAGILWWAPPWRDALAGWLPRWLAEAVAVSAAAQLACTPVIAALSGEVSLVAVVANLAAGPVVGVTTVAGLLGGVVHLALPPVAGLAGRVAGVGAGWIIAVATWGAGLPTPSVPWPTSPGGLACLAALCLALALGGARLLRRRAVTVVGLGLAAAWVLLPSPRVGWPEDGWVLAVCDVGQGDALVLPAGPGAAMVVDAGPDPEPVDRCLRRLGVTRVPTLVLTHFHADHVDGLAGVLEGRRVGEVLVSPLAAPSYGVEAVRRTAAAAGVPVRVPTYGETRHSGPLTWQVVGPSRVLPGDVSDGSTINNASVTVLADVRGTRLLLPGDAEPEAQAALERALPTLHVDVLKVPHHGSAHQDLDVLQGLGAAVAVVPVGVDNDYGHPADATLEALTRAGVTVGRTDLQGDLLVVRRADGALDLVGTR